MELVNKARAILGPAEAHLDKWMSSGDKARWTGGQFPIFKKYSISNLFQYFLYPVYPLRSNDKTIWWSLSNILEISHFLFLISSIHPVKWTSSGDKNRWTGGQFTIFKKYPVSNLFKYF